MSRHCHENHRPGLGSLDEQGVVQYRSHSKWPLLSGTYENKSRWSCPFHRAVLLTAHDLTLRNAPGAKQHWGPSASQPVLAQEVLMPMKRMQRGRAEQ